MNHDKVKIGLYGNNGHQIQNRLVNHPAGEVAAVCGIAESALPAEMRETRRCATLDEMLAMPDIDLVSLCSPLRSQQARDAITCLNAGKHVYAEKPCAMLESDLNEIIATAKRTGRRFHEQAGTILEQPYRTLRKIVQSGVLGTIVQVYAQKSYPWFDSRPQDENVDGGLAMQAGIYCARFVEHVACERIAGITMKETTLGNPVAGGQCRRAVSMVMELANGGLASAVANYLCPMPPSWQKWGYETLRIWGVNGFVESIDYGRVGTLALTGRQPESLDFSQPAEDYLGAVLREIQTAHESIPLSIEEELSPTRWVIRGRQQRKS